MGLRQHPGPLTICLLVLLTCVGYGCTLISAPENSFSGYRGSPVPDLPIELKLPAQKVLPVFASPGAAASSSPTSAETPMISSPLVLAMQSAGSHYERGVQAMHRGNQDQAEWEFDAALEMLLNGNLGAQSGARLLRSTQVSPYPPSPWIDTLADPARTLTTDAPPPASAEEPPLEAPALLGPEDVQAVTGTQPEEAAPLPEPDTGKHDIPVVFNDQVKAFIHYFQTRKWGVITRAFERASHYLPMMRKIFHEKGLPEDLLNLAFIESAVNPRATSRAKAAGIWQFVPSTGRLYGMRYSWWLDERRDPEKSTRGAAAYLKNLYNMFESWPLALAAYNAGEGKIQAAIQRQRSRNFWSLRLPKETRLYVPAFMAMTIISREPERYGFTPPPEAPFEVEIVPLEHPTELRLIAQASGSTVEDIRDLNPELIRWATPPGLSSYALRIPAGRRDAFLEALEQVPPSKRVTWIHHHVRKGETPGGIAKRYGLDIGVVLELNGLRKRQVLKPGMMVLLPGAAVGSGGAYAGEIQQAIRSATRPTSVNHYIVKRGDTLAGVAQAHAVSPQNRRRWNKLSRDARLWPGQTLTIRQAPQARAPHNSGPRVDEESSVAPSALGTKRYVVKRGDTMHTIARAHSVSPEDLRRWNNLSRDARLRPGQALEIRSPES